MTNLRRLLFVLLSIVGVSLLLLASFVFVTEEYKMFSGLCFGIGAVTLVFGIGNLIRSFIISAVEDKELKYLKGIEVKDERNINIASISRGGFNIETTPIINLISQIH